MSIPLSWFLILAAALFCIGLYGVLSRKNAIAILLGVELMLNAVNINLVAFWRYLDPAQMAARFQQFQQRIAQMDPAQMQEMAAQFMPGVAEMDPAQFQQMAERFQQGIGQMDPAMLQQMAEQ